ncbi:aldo/keto reductase [Opitutia bacterium ISCC 51]|nr:aldo/keto reductase [Opitutae bacterium ISCC 51]QXD30038.1 aldo/keto reductase [Opitutae bacterium ISCC 52]
MEYRRLGESDIKVSEMSLGCWTMGGLSFIEGKANGWANVDEDEIFEAVKRAVDAGVNHFDNADVYGNGRAEQMLARILKRIGLNNEDFVIATKMGHFLGDATHAYEPNHIRRQCEQSLKNLNRDYIDLFYLHHGNFGKNNEYLDGAADTMNVLVDEGKIRLKGQSAYTAAHFKNSVPVIQPTVLQSWAHAMDTQFIEPNGPVGRLMVESKLSYIAFSPLNKGILLDKFDPENLPDFEEGDHRGISPIFSKEALRDAKPRLAEIKKRFGDSIPELASFALRFVLSFPRVACVIPGFRNATQVESNLAVMERRLSPGDIAFIKSVMLAPAN